MTDGLSNYKRSALTSQRLQLIEEYQAANAQLARTLSDVDRLRLERQQLDLEERIAKTEADLMALNQPSGAPIAPGSDGPTAASPLMPSQRRHLQQEYSELETTYDSLTRAINALDTDISRTSEEFRKHPLQERREERIAERAQIVSRMAQIESFLRQ